MSDAYPRASLVADYDSDSDDRSSRGLAAGAPDGEGSSGRLDRASESGDDAEDNASQITSSMHSIRSRGELAGDERPEDIEVEGFSAAKRRRLDDDVLAEALAAERGVSPRRSVVGSGRSTNSNLAGSKGSQRVLGSRYAAHALFQRQKQVHAGSELGGEHDAAHLSPGLGSGLTGVDSTDQEGGYSGYPEDGTVASASPVTLLSASESITSQQLPHFQSDAPHSSGSASSGGGGGGASSGGGGVGVGTWEGGYASSYASWWAAASQYAHMFPGSGNSSGTTSGASGGSNGVMGPASVPAGMPVMGGMYPVSASYPMYNPYAYPQATVYTPGMPYPMPYPMAGSSMPPGMPHAASMHGDIDSKLAAQMRLEKVSRHELGISLIGSEGGDREFAAALTAAAASNGASGSSSAPRGFVELSGRQVHSQSEGAAAMLRSAQDTSAGASALRAARFSSVATKTWDADAGETVVSRDPSKLQKRKHHINVIAMQAQAQASQAAEMRASGAKARSAAHSKYGW